MKLINLGNAKNFPFGFSNSPAVLFLSIALLLIGGVSGVFAHGGEDHGDEQPKTATTAAGTVSRSARLGDFEIMIKHAALETDTAAAGRLFVTKFATNEPVGDANPALEIESAGGAVTVIAVEKTDAAGSYTIKLPALPEGAYTIRTKTTVAGKTDTATFSGVEIAHHETTESSGSSWLRTALMALTALVVLSLFGGLIYFAARGTAADSEPAGETGAPSGTNVATA